MEVHGELEVGRRRGVVYEHACSVWGVWWKGCDRRGVRHALGEVAHDVG